MDQIQKEVPLEQNSCESDELSNKDSDSSSETDKNPNYTENSEYFLHQLELF